MVDPQTLLAAVLGYLLGAIPFGLLLTRAAGLGDIRKIGSGNIGATNVLRTGNRKLAAATLLLDGIKGATAVLLGSYLAGTDGAFAGGLASVLGHLFPVWLGFKGGKGVATFYGVLFGVAWPVGIAAGLTWIIVAAILRFSSLAALAAAALAPLYFVLLREASVPRLILAAGMTVLIFLRHRDNIRRLLAGDEPHIGAHATPAGS